MATNVFTNDPALTNVSFETFRSTKKDEKSYVARLIVDGVRLPLVFDGASTEEAKHSAAAFFKSNVFDRVFDFSHATDADLTHKSVLSLFANKPSISNKNTRKSAGEADKRHAFKNMKWYVRKGETPVRIAEADVQKYVDDGYLPGKDWEVALAKHEGTYAKTNKKGQPGYKNPIAGTTLLHKGIETLRAEEDQVADLLRQGWTKGRVPKAEKVASAAPEKAAEPVSEDKGSTPASE